MKVSDVGSAKSGSQARKKDKVGDKGEFASHLRRASGLEDRAPVSEMIPVSTVDSILSLQEVGTATDQEGRRQLMRRGEDLLDRLEEIRRDLLLGAISKDRLANLAQALRARRQSVQDPALLAVIDEIELRAEVEIAKWTRTTSR